MKSATESRLTSIVLAAAMLLAAAGETSPSARASQSQSVSPRIARLEAWLSAIESHEPGALDEAVLQIARWPYQDLRLVWIDIMSVVSLVREPDVSLFFISDPAPGASASERQTSAVVAQRRATQVLYTVRELNRLRELARPLTKRAGSDSDVLRRGAMLHADIAMLAPTEQTANDSGGAFQRTTLYMNDGRQTGLQSAVNHWDMGRRLLDRVRPDGKELPNKVVSDPAGDAVVRLWYLATNAYLQSLMYLEPAHANRAVELFPKDPEILFFTGAFHETAANPRIQAALRDVKAPRGITFGVGGEGQEFRLAEQFYRRALEANPALVEARIRLGRVLGKRGRHQEALEQLRVAIPKTTEPLLQYYGALFMGAAAEAVGNEDEARQSYQRAASLYPTAQSPILALSRLEGRFGHSAAARQAIGQLLKLTSYDDERADPWWIYDLSQGRNVEGLLADLRGRF